MPGWRQQVGVAPECSRQSSSCTDTGSKGPDTALAGEVASHIAGSSLVAHLLMLWAWGLFSPQQLQSLAEKASRDLEDALSDAGKCESIKQDLKKLKSLGTSGKYANHMHRDLMDRMEESKMQMWYVKMPLRMLSRAKNMLYMLSQTMLLPHLLFSTMGNFYPAAFSKLMCPSPERLAAFWESMQGNPQLQCMSTSHGSPFITPAHKHDL